MKTPVHRWKEHVTFADGRKPYWTFDGKPCWLGSGVVDKNGREIFEGDIVEFDIKRFCQFIYPHPDYELDNLYYQPPKDGIAIASYQYGALCLVWERDNRTMETPLKTIQTRNFNCFFEVVGHIAEDITP